jgi:hypothetical protein
MKKIITLAAVFFCIMSSNAQTKQNYIKRDTIEVIKYDELGMEHHYKVIHYEEVGDPKYWERIHRNRHRWNRISAVIFTIGSTAMIVGMATSIN